MKTSYTFGLVAVSAICAPHFSFAGEIGVAFTIDYFSEYVDDGFQLSDGPAVQPSFELSYAGFYAGAWASNADTDLLGAESEVRVFAGYRDEVGSVFYDVSGVYYTFQEDRSRKQTPFGTVDFIDNFQEYIGVLGYSVTSQLRTSVEVGYSPAIFDVQLNDEFSATTVSATVDYDTGVPGLSVSATYGVGEISTDLYEDYSWYAVGGRYALADTVAFGLSVHDNDEDPFLVGTLSFTF